MLGEGGATVLIGLVRYLTADLLRSQRFLLPVFLYLLLLAPLFNGDPGPPPELWIVTVLVLYPVSCWLAVTIANTEDPIQRQVTIAAAGGPARVAAGVLLTCLAADALLVATAVFWPVLTTRYAFSPSLLVEGTLAHVAAATTGTAVGLLCARPVIHGVGWSVVIGGGVVFLTATRTWLPPVGLTVRTLDEGTSVGTLGVQALLGLTLAGLATVATVVVHNRR
jgi:hypothetical protein